jgi:SAM-dependent methyltransferase
MHWIMAGFILFCGLVILLFVLNQYSYGVLKRRVVRRRRWDLNICCGRTDGGGVNADIVKHTDLPNFQRISDIRNLPFSHDQFDWVLCSHTIEHVDDPDGFADELQRVGRNVVYVIPPIWDLSAVLNVFEHKWIFLTVKTEHVNKLPARIRLPFARIVQRALGQTINA